MILLHCRPNDRTGQGATLFGRPSASRRALQPYEAGSVKASFREWVQTPIRAARKRPRQTGHGSTLFDGVLEQLRSKGLVLEEGSLVDAMIVEQARGGKNAQGQSTRDRTASFTKKHGRTYHGFKAHVSVSKDRLVSAYVFDTAKVHHSQHIDALIEGETEAVYADSAYVDKQRSADLADRGMHDGIVRRRVRGQAELTDEQKRHNRAASKVRTRVENPFVWMGQMGYGKARYRGLARNGLDFGLTALAYNIKRSLSLLGLALWPLPKAA